MALRRLRDAAGVEDAAKLEAEAAEAAKAVDAHRRSVGKAWPVAPRYLRHGGDREEVVAGTDSLGNNARVVPPPLQQQPSLENATRWPVDAVLARLRAHLAMGRRDPRFGLKTATQELRRLVFVLQPPVADSLGPGNYVGSSRRSGCGSRTTRARPFWTRAPGLSINSDGNCARAASQHKVAPPPTQQMNATQQRRCLVETPPPPPPSPPRKPKAQEEATLATTSPTTSTTTTAPTSEQPARIARAAQPAKSPPPTAGRNARRARRRSRCSRRQWNCQNKDHSGATSRQQEGGNIIFWSTMVRLQCLFSSGGGSGGSRAIISQCRLRPTPAVSAATTSGLVRRADAEVRASALDLGVEVVLRVASIEPRNDLVLE